MTVPEQASNPPSCKNPIGIGKSTAHDAHDGDDDELQRFSKGVAALFLEMRDGAMGVNIGSIRPSKCDADPEPRGPTSSRTSSAARVELPIPLYLEESVFIHTPHP
jgi:hypothetical protein